MRTGDVILFSVYTVTSVVSLLVIKMWFPAAISKWSDGALVSAPSVWIGFGAILYVTSFLVWMTILSRNELSLAYPTAIGLTLVFSTVAARLILQEDLSAMRIIGMLTIMLGIVLVVRS